MKPVLIGQAPSRDGKTDFQGASGKRLALWAGVGDLSKCFETRNLLDYYPGSNGKGDLFPPAEARLSAKKMLFDEGPPRGSRWICVGKAVAKAFWIDQYPPFEWLTASDGPDLAWIPHPSGVNRIYNGQESIAAVSRFLREAKREAGRI